MPMTALHPVAGLLDVTREDLGGGLRWADVHRAQPPAPLTCRACSAPLSAKLSVKHRRFFAHRPGASNCPMTGETFAHHLLKAELASAVRDAGWHAELEVAGEGWRADVLATSQDGTRRMAWEAQLASATAADLAERTAVMARSGVEVCWVTDRDVPWVTHVPSIRLRRIQEVEVESLPAAEAVPAELTVAHGHGRFAPSWCADRGDCEYAEDFGQRFAPCPGHGSWLTPEPLALARFVRAVCQRSVRTHETLNPVLAKDSRHDGGRIVWTSEQHHDAEAIEREALAAYERWALPHLRAEEARERDRARHLEYIEALLTRQAGLIRPTVELVYGETGVYPEVLDGPRDPRWANGVPVLIRGQLAAVICPVANRIDAHLRTVFASVPIVVSDGKERQRLAKVCSPQQRFTILPVDPQALPQKTAVPAHEIARRMFGRAYY